MIRKLQLIALSLTIAIPAFGQGVERPPAAPVRIGPLDVYPTLALTNLGFDGNVFNESNQAAPKQDFAFDGHAGGRSQDAPREVTADGNPQGKTFVYYQTYASERSANSDFKAGLQLLLTRMILKGGASYLSTRERPGFEIDLRSQRNEISVNGAVEVRALPKTFAGLRGSRTDRLRQERDLSRQQPALRVEPHGDGGCVDGAVPADAVDEPHLRCWPAAGSVLVLAAPGLRLDPHRGRRHFRAACAAQGVGVLRLPRLPTAFAGYGAVQGQRRRRGPVHGPRPDEAWPPGRSRCARTHTS